MALFEIVELSRDGGIKPVEAAGKFPDGKAAADYIPSLLSQHPDRKFQPRPVAEEKDWRARELEKFATGEYQPLPWNGRLTPIADHFAHRSKKTAENVAYTPSEEHGKTDRQISTHVNNYLLRFYPDLTIEQRRAFVREYTGVNVVENLHFCQSADEIVSIYENGPSSCMAGGSSDWVEGEHPTQAYFGHGLTVAYISSKGYVTARAVVHLERKIFHRAYGDTDLITEALEASGYRYAPSGNPWEGVELSTKWIEGGYYNEDDEWIEGEGYLCPYLDFANRGRLSEDGDRIIISRTGDLALQNTDGLTYELSGQRCGVCKKTKCGDFQHYEPGLYACEDCCVEKHGWCAIHGHALYHGAPVVILHDGRKAMKDKYHLHQCAVTGEWHLKRELPRHPERPDVYITPAELAQLQKAA